MHSTDIVLYFILPPSFLRPSFTGEALALRMDSWRCIPPGVVAIIMTVPWGGEIVTMNTLLFKEGFSGDVR
jgi:hypothetical protein